MSDDLDYCLQRARILDKEYKDLVKEIKHAKDEITRRERIKQCYKIIVEMDKLLES